jgi:hypothetical protein
MCKRLEVDEWWPMIGAQDYMKRFHPACLHVPGFLPE